MSAMSAGETLAPFSSDAQTRRVHKQCGRRNHAEIFYRSQALPATGAKPTASSRSAVQFPRELRGTVRSPHRKRHSKRMCSFGEFSTSAPEQSAIPWMPPSVRSRRQSPTQSISFCDEPAPVSFDIANADPFRSNSAIMLAIGESQHCSSIDDCKPPAPTSLWSPAEATEAITLTTTPWRSPSCPYNASLAATATHAISPKVQRKNAANLRYDQEPWVISERPAPKHWVTKVDSERALSVASSGDTQEAQVLVALPSKPRNRRAWRADGGIEESTVLFAKPEMTGRAISATAPGLNQAGTTNANDAVSPVHRPGMATGGRSQGPPLTPVAAGVDKRPSMYTLNAAIGPKASDQMPLPAPSVAPTPGTVASPFSPVLESELFESESESINEPLYELSDTTILDVNPSLLLPLSGCNFFFIIVSGLLFLGSLYAYVEQESTPASTSPNTWLVYLFLHLEVVFMVVALVIFVVALIGFLGALRQNVTLLDTYSTLQGAFVSAEIILVILVFFLPIIGREFVISHITTELIVHYRDNVDYRNEIDYVQSTLRCCGMTENAYRDWNANAYFNCSPTNPSAERCSVPPSCCRRREKAEFGLDDDIPPETQSTGEEDTKNKKGRKGESQPSLEVLEDEGTVMTTLCGRGVMNLKEQDAWKRIYTRGCGPAMFHYVESRVVEIVLFTLLLVLIHLTLISLAVNVRKEIKALGKVYDKYYKAVYRGQKRMKQMHVIYEESFLQVPSPKVAPLVTSLEAHKQRHRRRYLGAVASPRPPPPQGAPSVSPKAAIAAASSAATKK